MGAHRPRRAHNVEDLRRGARRALPRSVFEFVDGGAEDEHTLRRNSADLAALALVPRVLAGVSAVDTSTTLLGQPVSVPVIGAPTGLSTLVAPEGETAVARGVHDAGSLYLVSGASGRPLEEVAAAARHPRPWLQLYVWRDRGLVRDTIARASDAGFAALAVTVDAPVAGRRERDIRNGFTIPPRLGVRTIAQGLVRPRWSYGFLRSDGLRAQGVGPASSSGPAAFAARVEEQMDDSLTWESLDWLRAQWDGPLLVKGVLHPEDAVRAVAAGADGVIVSNHGGRQLDGAVSSIRALPRVADAVGDGTEVYVDGGIRRGADVVRALALGARACLVGRPALYGLACAGSAGVRRVIEMLGDELATAMTLLGARRVDDIKREHVTGPAAADHAEVTSERST